MLKNCNKLSKTIDHVLTTCILCAFDISPNDIQHPIEGGHALWGLAPTLYHFM